MYKKKGRERNKGERKSVCVLVVVGREGPVLRTALIGLIPVWLCQQQHRLFVTTIIWQIAYVFLLTLAPLFYAWKGSRCSSRWWRDRWLLWWWPWWWPSTSATGRSTTCNRVGRKAQTRGDPRSRQIQRRTYPRKVCRRTRKYAQVQDRISIELMNSPSHWPAKRV